jgi:hypothetical protein
VFKLTPDISGSYENGTWTELASKPFISSAAAQAVLPDGRVIIEGGEYSGYAYNEAAGRCDPPGTCAMRMQQERLRK